MDLKITIRLNVIMHQKDLASKNFTFFKFSSRSNRFSQNRFSKTLKRLWYDFLNQITL